MDFSKPSSELDLQRNDIFATSLSPDERAKMQCLGDMPGKAGRLRGGPTTQ
jgi:hypothetical protein